MSTRVVPWIVTVSVLQGVQDVLFSALMFLDTQQVLESRQMA